MPRTILAFLLLLGAVTLLGPTAASAATDDYKLELVGKPVRDGKLVTFSVQLVKVTDKSVVPDAELTILDFNMEPEGMSGSDPVTMLPSDAPDVWQLQVYPLMSGRWALVYEAKIPGEPEPIEGRLTVRVPE